MSRTGSNLLHSSFSLQHITITIISIDHFSGATYLRRHIYQRSTPPPSLPLNRGKGGGGGGKGKGDRQIDDWFLTPSQPQTSYQGERKYELSLKKKKKTTRLLLVKLLTDITDTLKNQNDPNLLVIKGSSLTATVLQMALSTHTAWTLSCVYDVFMRNSATFCTQGVTHMGETAQKLND